MLRWLVLPAVALALGIGATAAHTNAGAQEVRCASLAQLQQRREALSGYRRRLGHRKPGRHQRAKLRRLARRVPACKIPPPPAPPASGAPQLLPFFPQAGIMWEDLFVYNFVDLDPSDGVLDWNCGQQSYDTHSGEDSIIRSFLEQAIGVPVFAALDGTVSQMQGPYYPDHSYGTHTQPYDNHVVIAHANRQETVYGHLKTGSITVKVGQHVLAGQQIGLTGSSGNSSGPHLHLTVRSHGDAYEPFAGPCRPGAGGWLHQIPQRTEPYVRGFTFSARPFAGRAALPWDEGVRTGTFVAGVRDVYFRLELGNAPTGAARVRFQRPDGSTASDDRSPLELLGAPRAPFVVRHYRPNLTVGRWPFWCRSTGACSSTRPSTWWPTRAPS